MSGALTGLVDMEDPPMGVEKLRFRSSGTHGLQDPKEINGHIIEFLDEIKQFFTTLWLLNCFLIKFTQCLMFKAVQRDPITGLGALPKEHVELGRTRNASTGRPAFNTTLIAWDVDNATVCKNNGYTTKKSKQPTRNPIALTGDLGDEVDRLRTTNGSRSGTPRERKSCLYLLKGKNVNSHNN
ncbi:unnamed protein product [Schistosoma margrebowiei]|uniref:Uncharacterized protein n=1 Tax=Schistosoma margrebowiei TaxID=48269 RepID=A0A183L8U2_9TREM|nr:unnamed protein product [Schistosoma margrebowiei]